MSHHDHQTNEGAKVNTQFGMRARAAALFNAMLRTSSMKASAAQAGLPEVREGRRTRMTGAAACKLLLALAVALILSTAFAVSLASAATGHNFDGTLGGSGDGDGLFDPRFPPAGVGVLGPSGDVLVADQGETPSQGSAPRIQRFDSSGAFASAFALGSSGKAYDTALAVAVDSSGSGAVYVDGTNNGDPPNTGDGSADVLKFDADGTFKYLLDEASAGVAFQPGSANGGAAALAVDPVDGSVYVSAIDNTSTSPVVARFDGSTGGFVNSSLDGSSSPEGAFLCPPTSLAVDGAQEVYVLDPCKGHVDRYTAAGVYDGTVDDGSRGTPKAVAVDPVSGEVYVAETGVAYAGVPGTFGLTSPHVTRFAPGGGAVISTIDLGASFGLEGSRGVVGMAVSGAGTVYVADSFAIRVARFVRFDGPTVTTGASSVQSPQEATVEGSIDPEGVAATYHFEYGIEQADGSGSYDSRTAESDPVAGSGAVPVSVALTGLKPNKTYHYRLVGSNASGSIYGADEEFTTARAPASVDSPEFASAIGPRSAVVHGAVNPNSTALSGFGFTLYHFEYGTTLAYGSTAVGSDGGTICFSTNCGGDYVSLAASLSGLLPGTIYHFRVVGDNGFGGAQAGADQTFITAPAAGGGASGVTTTHAALTGTINRHGAQTSYYFNYGETSAYGASTAAVDAGAVDGDQRVSLPVSGLLPDTTYHVQVVATSTDGVTRYGADGLFRTAPVPTAVSLGPVGVSLGSATLVGELTTFALPGSYHFEISSSDGSYRASTAERAAAGNTGAQQVSVPIEGLAAGQTFFVRLVVTSNDSTTHSDQVTFATPSLPRAFPIALAGQLASASNAVATAISHEPDSSFSITRTSMKGSTATVSIAAPGPGTLETSGNRTKAATTTVTKAGAASVTVKLTTAASRALKRAKSHSLKVKVNVRFTPVGGKPAGKTVTVTFKRKAGR